MKHYLMIKTHSKTRLKYLCKKSTTNINSCFRYLGSGTYWKKHLIKHGKNIETEIIEMCNSKQELTEKGIYWSKKLNVVKSDGFANLVEERGDGGPTMLGRKITKNQKVKQIRAIRKYWLNLSPDLKAARNKANSLSHEKYTYYTPLGTYTNAYRAAEAHQCCNVTIINRCVVDTDKPILSKKYWKCGWKNKTWRMLGWYSVSLHTQSQVPDL